MAQRRKRNRKWLWGLMIVILIAAIVAGVVIWQNNNRGSSDVGGGSNGDSSKTEDANKNKEQAPTSPQSDTYTTDTIEKQKIVQYEGEDPNMANDLSGVVTYADVVDGTLMIRVSIDQYLTNGVCELSLVRSGATVYTEKANIIGDVSTATCEGFNISTDSLGGGDVEIIINLDSDGRVGVIRGEVEL